LAAKDVPVHGDVGALMNGRVGYLSLGVALALACGMARAQPAANVDVETYHATVAAARIAISEAPEIDGDLSDLAWAKAGVTEGLYQVEPNRGAPATERTVIRLMFDEDNLYVGIYAYDSEPEKIVATVMERDGDVTDDDHIAILIDPLRTRRDGYDFEMNPLGTRRDGLTQNNTELLVRWDTIWRGRARIVSDGWIAELAIPFRSIAYDPKQTEWGLQIARAIQRKREFLRWSGADPSINAFDLTRAGTLTSVRGASQGIGLDVQPFVTASWKREWQKPGEEDDLTAEPSGNVFYKITPSLTGTLTFNTDFSDTPLDDRRVNTTRFALFFAETREFFLQDASVFEFGGRAFDAEGDPNGNPFFTRRIGFASRGLVDIAAGAKLSGKEGIFSVGALTAVMGEREDLDSQILSAVRLSAEVLEQSKVGVILTNGDPTGLDDNTVAGADFQYRNTSWFDGDLFRADFFYLRSFASAVEDDSFGVELAYPNDRIHAYLRFREIGADFDPALGFVNRPGIRSYFGFFRHRTRPSDGMFRAIDLGTWFDYVTDLGDRVESRVNGGWSELQLHDGAEARLELWESYERVLEPFDLPKGLIVPAGEYTEQTAALFFRTSPSATIVLDGAIQVGGFFGGEEKIARLAVTFRPSGVLRARLQHRIQEIDVPAGGVTIHITSLESSLNFSPDAQLLTQVQYDNISKNFSLSARYRWEYLPGSEFFVALSDASTIDGKHFRTETTNLAVRLGHTFQF
jgi:hypothetical protein